MPRPKQSPAKANSNSKPSSTTSTPQRRSKRAAPVADTAPITPPPPKRPKRTSAVNTPKYKDESDGDGDQVNGIVDKNHDVKPKRTPKSSAQITTGTNDRAADSAKASSSKPGKSPKKAKDHIKDEDQDFAAELSESDHDTSTMRKATKTAANTAAKASTAAAKKPRAPRKSAEQKAAEAIPLAVRTPVPSNSTDPAHYIGAHVSGAGGVHNALTNAVHIGANALALFLKSQRKWDNPPLKPDVAQQFRSAAIEHKYSAERHVLPHGSYLVNLAAEDKAKADQAYASFVDDLKRCKELGIGLYNFHPGNTNGKPRGQALARLAGQLNRAHKETAAKKGESGVAPVTLLENMAAAPTANTIGGKFEDLRDVIALVEDKTRVGVCLDTCHAFAAGYDIRTIEGLKKVLKQFDDIVGAKYLRAVHLNDSKGMLSSHRDLHQNIGLGFLGLRAFHALMNEARFRGMPMVLETPIDKKDANGKDVEDKEIWAKEIKLLESLVGMDVEGDEFKNLEKQLAGKGIGERNRLEAQFERKKEKDAKSPKKNRQMKADSDEDE